jgi:hypothetical protein
MVWLEVVVLWYCAEITVWVGYAVVMLVMLVGWGGVEGQQHPVEIECLDSHREPQRMSDLLSFKFRNKVDTFII